MIWVQFASQTWVRKAVRNGEVGPGIRSLSLGGALPQRETPNSKSIDTRSQVLTTRSWLPHFLTVAAVVWQLLVWLACWLAGLLACWLVWVLACWLAGSLACWLAGASLLVCLLLAGWSEKKKQRSNITDRSRIEETFHQNEADGSNQNIALSVPLSGQV